MGLWDLEREENALSRKLCAPMLERCGPGSGGSRGSGDRSKRGQAFGSRLNWSNWTRYDRVTTGDLRGPGYWHHASREHPR